MNTYARLLKYLLPFKYMLLSAVFCMFMGSVLMICNFYLLTKVLEVFFEGEDYTTMAASSVGIDKSKITNAEKPEETDPKKIQKEKTVKKLIAKYPSLKKFDDIYQTLKEKRKYYSEKFVNFLRQKNPMQALKFIGIILLIIELLKFFFTFASESLSTYVGLAVVNNLKCEMYDHVLNLDMKFFETKTTGHLMSRITGDVTGVRNSLMVVCDNIFREPITIVMTLSYLLYTSYQLTVITFLFIPLTFFTIIKIGRKIKKLSKKERKKIADISGTMQEILSGIRIVKAFRMEKFELKKFRIENNKHFKFLLDRRKVKIISNPLMDLFGMLVAIGVLFLGGYYVFTKKTMTGPEFGIYLYALQQLYRPIKKLGKANEEIQQGLAHAERIFGILDTKSNIVESANPIDIPTLNDRLSFNNVNFSYNGVEQVLRGVSFEVKKGKKVAIVGPSGAGKSTIINLIPRFYDPIDGLITIDGVNIREASLDSLCRQIGMVTQQGILFNDTIRNNIAYGFENISDEKVIEAAKAANAHDFILSLKDGYNTMVGERGFMLSGGQGQRVTIARAILKDPAILILDEATSSLDSESESLIQKAIDNLIANRTTIMIAHRLSTVMNADEILVIDKGLIVERGTHQQLLEKSGLYAKLCEFQFGENVVIDNGNSA